MKLFTRLLNPRFQFFFFAVLALFVTGLVAFCSPEQFPIVRRLFRHGGVPLRFARLLP